LDEDTKAATATAQAFRSAYERAAAAIKREYGDGPPPLAPLEPIGREVSGQRQDVMPWLDKTVGRLTGAIPVPGEQTGAALIIGHDPGMSWLLAQLLHPSGNRFRRGRDVPALARAELMGMRWQRGRWQPMWALTPSATDDINAVIAKIKSKMDTAKVFGGFLTALLTVVITQYASVAATTAYWAVIRGVSLAAFAVAILFYLLTMFWYDRPLMPTRFWETRRHRPTGTVTKILLRPPSSAVWVLYQNMQRTWRLLFVPATYSAAIGIAGFGIARVEPSTATALVTLLASAVVVVAIAAWWGWRSRPILGVQD
jgi:hypothetical protein